jgi:hypothetical protein
MIILKIKLKNLVLLIVIKMFYYFICQYDIKILIEAKNKERALKTLRLKACTNIFNGNIIIEIGKPSSVIKKEIIFPNKNNIIDDIEEHKKSYQKVNFSECGDFYIYLNNFPLFLQHSNQKEISPIIHDFINHPLFDKNVLGVINDYFKD